MKKNGACENCEKIRKIAAQDVALAMMEKATERATLQNEIRELLEPVFADLPAGYGAAYDELLKNAKSKRERIYLKKLFSVKVGLALNGIEFGESHHFGGDIVEP